MMQPSDKELDKMIREAAEQFEKAGATPNWEGMRELLEEKIPLKKEPNRKPFLLLIILFILLGGSYLYIKFNKPSDSNPYTAKKTAVPVEINKEPTSNSGKISNGNSDTHLTTSDQLQAVKHETDFPSNIASTLTLKHQLANNNRQLKNVRTGYTSITTSAGETAENNLPATAIDAMASKETKAVPLPIPVLSSEPSSNITEPKKIDNISVEITSTEKVKSVETGNPVSGKKNRQPDTKKHPFEISLVYAPELTTIKLSGFDKPGSSYGILIGYDIFKNFSIQTGVARSRKNYTAKGTDFKSNYPVTPPYKLSSVKGFCNMYEIPLNLKYQLSHGKKINTIAIAGISSFFMTRESYNFLYSSTNMGSYNWSNEYRSQKNYWFSHATIGIGFEKEISSSINIAATPFVKIPLKAMGTGELKLLTTGINFSLSFRPAFGKFH